MYFLTQVNECWSFQVKQNGVKEKTESEKFLILKVQTGKDFCHLAVNSKSNTKWVGIQYISSDRNYESTQYAHLISKNTELLQILMKLLQIWMRTDEENTWLWS